MRIGVIAMVICALASSAGAQVELVNDNCGSGCTAAFEAGFASGEIGAARFDAAMAGLQLLKVHLIFGGQSTAMRTMTVKVYDDSAGTVAPGVELASMDYTLTGNDMAIQEVDLSASNVTVPQQFRVGLVFPAGCAAACGAPTIARDATPPEHINDNYIFGIPGGWVTAHSQGVTGNWIIRAVVSGSGSGGSGGGGPDAGTGGTCTSNVQCPSGQYCNLTSHACTFDCRTTADCASGTCNSLGMCVGGSKHGGCAVGGDGAALAALGVLGFAIFVRRRRA
jgi:MYXO-CTERM domain-containing protein